MGEIKKKATTTMINERFILKHKPAFEFPALTNFFGRELDVATFIVRSNLSQVQPHVYSFINP